MGAMIIAEIGDFSRFDSPGKILAYAGLSPLHINQVNWNRRIRIWKNAAPDISDMLYLMQQSLYATGIRLLLLT